MRSQHCFLKGSEEDLRFRDVFGLNLTKTNCNAVVMHIAIPNCTIATYFGLKNPGITRPLFIHYPVFFLNFPWIPPLPPHKKVPGLRTCLPRDVIFRTVGNTSVSVPPDLLDWDVSAECDRDCVRTDYLPEVTDVRMDAETIEAFMRARNLSVIGGSIM